MKAGLEWSDALDTRLRRLRATGATWNAIAAELGATRWCVIERGRRIGAPQPPPACEAARRCDDDRAPLPAGHPRSWGAITHGTLLHQRPYPFPVFDLQP